VVVLAVEEEEMIDMIEQRGGKWDPLNGST